MSCTDWQNKRFSFFSHKACESFPCHEGVDEDDFNCLFCYCPLYALGDRCGGSIQFLPNGIKDCSACNFPHERGNYGIVTARLREGRDAK